MNSTPLVSVIVVSYNDWPDLELAIESALQQTYPRVEVIVVDNGSTDATSVQVPARFGAKVRYIRQENLRAAGGRNTGLAAARGELIQFLDGDDVLAPNKIAKQVDFLLKNPGIDVAIGRYRCFRSTPDVPAEVLFDYDARSIFDPKALFLDRCPAPPLAMLFWKRVADHVGPQDRRIYFEDYDFWLRVAFAGFQFGVTPEAWSFYRRRKGQKTQFRSRAALADLAVFSRALHYVREEPYRTKLKTKLARLTHSLGHYYLWLGDAHRAKKLLRRSARIWPADSHGRPRPYTQWMSNVPGGAKVYQMLRRAKGLRPPFAVDPDASRKEAAPA